MKNRKLFMRVAAVLLLCAALAGCGIGETGQTTEPTRVATQAQPQFTTAPTQAQEKTIYNTRLLPLSASHAYTRQEILDALQLWLDAGYTLEEALGLARNEIYADCGYSFRDGETECSEEPD